MDTETTPKEWVILAKRHEQSGGPNIGAPFYGPNYGGYIMRLSGAGLYTEAEARKEAGNCGPGELLPYHFADPKLREYLDHWHKTRSSEFDLFHQVRSLQAELVALEQRRQYGADIINDMTLEADLQVKAELTLVGALAELPKYKMDGENWFVPLDDLIATLQVHAKHRGWADAVPEGGAGK
ncbi:hypothetical protein Q5H92_22815 [Hymenobacter sp. M29]|uniref:Uncharacterized protein n=1 Tax=Hymenobacter mellowenesis TaxID=3063995 RepID=A0ABT9AIN8_9BACT|nr:hypothetical protein [Hymenobacter sp. M29]MDO7849214.1 hypothetical protein [Hymenobacter sp. M29]